MTVNVLLVKYDSIHCTLSYCNGLLKYCKGYKFALSVARPRSKKLSASSPPDALTRGFAPGPAGGFVPRPQLEARAPRARHVPPKLPMAPLSQYSGAGAGREGRECEQVHNGILLFPHFEPCLNSSVPQILPGHYRSSPAHRTAHWTSTELPARTTTHDCDFERGR